MKNIKTKRMVIASSLTIVLSLLLSSCSSFPLPDHLRYKRINAVVNEIDYQKSGEVLNERYDSGDGVFSPSFFRVDISGDVGTYDFLKKEILKIENITCDGFNGEGYMNCKLGEIDIDINLNNEKNNPSVTLVVTDVYGGREEKDES